MSRFLKFAVGAVTLVVLLAAGLYAYRSVMLYEGRTPEGYPLLTPVPASAGFEPRALPSTPVLENRSAQGVAVDFGYKVGGTSYSYTLALAFDGSAGRATVTARHATRDAAVETATVQRWDAPRNAYSVALQDRFHLEPPVPALCIKTVIGPQAAALDLRDASLCVAQMDASGSCHPETLACGTIR